MVPREAVQRWRLVLSRSVVDGEQQRAQLQAWEAALAGCGLPIAGLDAATPRPRFAIAAPLAASIPGAAELVDVWLAERLPRWRVREGLERTLPVDYRLVDVFDVWPGEAPLPGQVVASVYRAALGGGSTGRAFVDVAALRDVATAMLAAASLSRARRKGETTVTYDLRPFLDALEVIEDPERGVSVRMTLRHDPEKGVGRPEEVLGELGDRLGKPFEPVSLVRERLVLASDRRRGRG